MSRVSLSACQFLVLLALVSTAIAASPGPRRSAVRFRQMTFDRAKCVTAAGPDSIRFQETRLRTRDLQATESLVGRRGEAKPAARRTMDDVEDGFLHWRGKTPPAMLIPTEIRSNPVIPASGAR